MGERLSLPWGAGTQLSVVLRANFSHFVLAYANHLSEKLELEASGLLQIIHVQGNLVGATDGAVENPDKYVVGFLFIAQMQQVRVGVNALAGAGGVCGHFGVFRL